MCIRDRVESDLRHIVDICVADVPYRDAGVRIALLDLQEAFRGPQVGGGTHTHVLGANLLQKEKLIVTRLGRCLRTQFDAWCIFVHVCRSGPCRRKKSSGAQSAANCQLEEFSAVRTSRHCIRLLITHAAFPPKQLRHVGWRRATIGPLYPCYSAEGDSAFASLVATSPIRSVRVRL